MDLRLRCFNMLRRSLLLYPLLNDSSGTAELRGWVLEPDGAALPCVTPRGGQRAAQALPGLATQLRAGGCGCAQGKRPGLPRQAAGAELTVLYAEERFSLTALLFAKLVTAWAELGVTCVEGME